MADTATISKLAKAAKAYARDVRALITAGSTTEATYYPALKTLIEAGLAVENLPFVVRINTSEQKAGGGINLPDVALYDSDGDFLVVCGEVKLPDVEIHALAMSTENKDQIGSSAFESSIAAVVAAGLAGSFLPYLLRWYKSGHFVYIADKDNQYYLQLASRLYYGNLFLYQRCRMRGERLWRTVGRSHFQGNSQGLRRRSLYH